MLVIKQDTMKTTIALFLIILSCTSASLLRNLQSSACDDGAIKSLIRGRKFVRNRMQELRDVLDTVQTALNVTESLKNTCEDVLATQAESLTQLSQRLASVDRVHAAAAVLEDVYPFLTDMATLFEALKYTADFGWLLLDTIREINVVDELSSLLETLDSTEGAILEASGAYSELLHAMQQEQRDISRNCRGRALSGVDENRRELGQERQEQIPQVDVPDWLMETAAMEPSIDEVPTDEWTIGNRIERITESAEQTLEQLADSSTRILCCNESIENFDIEELLSGWAGIAACHGSGAYNGALLEDLQPLLNSFQHWKTLFAYLSHYASLSDAIELAIPMQFDLKRSDDEYFVDVVSYETISMSLNLSIAVPDTPFEDASLAASLVMTSCAAEIEEALQVQPTCGIFSKQNAANGELCCDNVDCQSGFCSQGLCSEGRNGDACDGDSHCLESNCINSVCTSAGVCSSSLDCSETESCVTLTDTAVCSNKRKESPWYVRRERSLLSSFVSLPLISSHTWTTCTSTVPIPAIWMTSVDLIWSAVAGSAPYRLENARALKTARLDPHASPWPLG